MKISYAQQERGRRSARDERPGGTPARRRKRHTGARLAVSVVLFLGLFGAKSLMPEAVAPAMAYLESTLTRSADLRETVAQVGEALAGQEEFSAVFQSLLWPVETTPVTLTQTEHLRAELRWLGSGGDSLSHYLPWTGVGHD